MHTPRSLCVLLLALLFALTASAQPPVGETGILHVAVAMPDGTPVDGIPVITTAGRLTVTTLTAADGACDIALPAGAISAALPAGEAHPATVTAGECADILLTLATPGLLVTLTYADGGVPDLRLQGQWLGGQSLTVPPVVTPLGEGRFWFTAPPPRATALALTGEHRDINGGAVCTGECPLTGDAPFRSLGLTLTRPAPTQLRLLPPGGAPLTDTTVNITLTNRRADGTMVSETVQVRTGADGVADIGRWQPGAYRVSALLVGYLVPEQTLTIAVDGTPDPATLTLSPRP